MAEIGSWNGHSFTVTPTLIRSFTGLTIKGSSETEDKSSDGQKYVSRTNGNPSEVSFTVNLNAFFGCDVKADAMKFIDEARSGAKNYLYIGGKKLLTCQLMLIEASISETEIAPGGAWVSCNVKLTMKQCTKNDGTTGSTTTSSGSSGSSGSSKSSVKKTSTTSSKSPPTPTDVSDLWGIGNVSNAVFGGALNQAVSVIEEAKKVSSTTKKPTTTNKVSSVISTIKNTLN